MKDKLQQIMDELREISKQNSSSIFIKTQQKNEGLTVMGIPLHNPIFTIDYIDYIRTK